MRQFRLTTSSSGEVISPTWLLDPSAGATNRLVAAVSISPLDPGHAHLSAKDLVDGLAWSEGLESLFFYLPDSSDLHTPHCRASRSFTITVPSTVTISLYSWPQARPTLAPQVLSLLNYANSAPGSDRAHAVPFQEVAAS